MYVDQQYRSWVGTGVLGAVQHVGIVKGKQLAVLPFMLPSLDVKGTPLRRLKAEMQAEISRIKAPVMIERAARHGGVECHASDVIHVLAHISCQPWHAFGTLGPPSICLIILPLQRGFFLVVGDAITQEHAHALEPALIQHALEVDGFPIGFCSDVVPYPSVRISLIFQHGRGEILIPDDMPVFHQRVGVGVWIEAYIWRFGEKHLPSPFTVFYPHGQEMSIMAGPGADGIEPFLHLSGGVLPLHQYRVTRGPICVTMTAIDPDRTDALSLSAGLLYH